MAKLTLEQISNEITKKGYTLVDASNYENMNSRILIKCTNNHIIETTLNDFRKVSFTCPVCDKTTDFINFQEVPAKLNRKRIVAFDQATEKFGVSIFDDGKLTYYHLYIFQGDVTTRLVKIFNFITEVVIKEWKPDFIVMEDIQYQNGILTYKILAMLLGILQMSCRLHDINYEVVSPNVWRKYAGTCGKTRKEEKLLSVAIVREKYNINVSDDVAEAILIGRYAVMTHKEVMMAFGK